MVAREEFAGIVGELLAPFEVVGQDPLEFLPRADPDDFMVEGLDRSEALGIPGRDFAELYGSAVFAEDLDHQVVMAPEHPDAFLKGWFGG